MSAAINETKRRRTIQINQTKTQYHTKTISKKIADIRSINRKQLNPENLTDNIPKAI